MSYPLVNIELPVNSFRRSIMLNVIRFRLGDSDVNFGNEYYVTGNGMPIRVNRKALDEINVLVNNFPKSCHILDSKDCNELLSHKYPDLVKLDPFTKLWYVIQNDKDNLMEIITVLESITKEYHVYHESDSEYNTVLTKILGFECINSKFSPNTIFIKNRPNISIIADRDFPIVSHKFDRINSETLTELIPGAAGLLWIFFNFNEYFEGKVDFDILMKVHYDPKIEIYIFPHVSDVLTKKITAADKFAETIGYKSFDSVDLATEAHLKEYINCQTLLLDKVIAWVKLTMKPEGDSVFKFLGSNDEDPITMEPFSELSGKRLTDVFLSDHRHNYINTELRNYFNGLHSDIKILPYDRDPCPYYKYQSKLASIGILPYHNKRGLFDTNKQYVCTPTEWEEVSKHFEFKMHKKPYYKAATVARLSINDDETSLSSHERSPITLDISGYYINVHSGEIYKPDSELVTIAVKMGLGLGHKAFQKVYEYLDTGLTTEQLNIAFRNGFLNIAGAKYLLFKRVSVITKFCEEESPLNDYLVSIIHKYIKSSR